MKPFTRQEGIGIVEFMVALLLLTIVVAGSMALQLTSLKTTSDSRISSAATVLAQSAIEAARGMSWTQLSAVCVATPTTSVQCFDFNTAAQPCPSFFQRTTSLSSTSVTTSAADSGASLSSTQGCQIQVQVVWTGQVGRQSVTQSLVRMP